jgi:hypothetical protein
MPDGFDGNLKIISGGHYHCYRLSYNVRERPSPLAWLILDPSYLLPDYPHNTGWMSEEERRLAQARIAEDAGEADRDNKEDSCVCLTHHSLWPSLDRKIQSLERPCDGGQRRQSVDSGLHCDD